MNQHFVELLLTLLLFLNRQNTENIKYGWNNG